MTLEEYLKKRGQNKKAKGRHKNAKGMAATPAFGTEEDVGEREAVAVVA